MCGFIEHGPLYPWKKKQMAMLTEKTNHGVAEGTGIHKQTQLRDGYPLIN